jgi:predicted alpha/beta-hydrolase family hydrolase
MTIHQNTNARLPNLKDHALIGDADKIPVCAPTTVISISPIVLSAPDRIIDLHLRVTAPITGDELPIILLSHGHGHSNNLSSLNGYAPVANFWASHGFVVIQPTHLSSKSLSVGPEAGSDAPFFWRSRVEDMKLILDELYTIEVAFPQIQGRLDHSRVVAVGHAMGGHTVSMLLGARLIDPEDGSEVDLIDTRVKAGVLLAAPGDGRGGEGLEEAVRNTFLKDHSHAEMTTPALVIVGDSDTSQLSTRGPEYHADAYYNSKGPKSLLTVTGGKHALGGVSGYDAAEAADDESPERLAMVQRLIWAYLRSRLYPEDPAWSEACFVLQRLPGLGRAESKRG